jgi:hypothetical protein
MHPTEKVNIVTEGILSSTGVLKFSFVDLDFQLVKYFTMIPSRFLRDIHIIRTDLIWRMKGIELLGREFVTGKKKTELTDWWLQTIEERVDEYLRDAGYQPDSIGYMYTSVAPDNLDIVQRNYRVFEDITKCRLQGYFEFILRTTEEIYSGIDPYITEMELLLDACKVLSTFCWINT